MKVYLFDDQTIKSQLLPLTYLRPVCGIRVGIQTLKEKWTQLSFEPLELVTDYLSVNFNSSIFSSEEQITLINGALCADENLVKIIRDLGPNTCLKKGDITLVARVENPGERGIEGINWASLNAEQINSPVNLIERPWHIFQTNAAEIKKDFKRLTKGRTSAEIKDPYTRLYGDNIFIEQGADIKDAVIDTGNGPVYIGKNAQIQMGTKIRGSFALLENASLSMGTRIRGDSTVGPTCKVGGEVGNSVFFGFSNKAHDGYLGNSVISEWCNIGADTNTSNMKNDYGNIRLWDYHSERFADTGSQFCGLMMGDHSKCGINVMFNSGTSIGVSCNLYNSNYHKNFVPSFSIGEAGKISTYPLKKALKVADTVMSRRNLQLSPSITTLFEKVFEISAKWRKD